MTFRLEERLRTCPVIPLIEAGDSATGVAVANALAAAGMPVVEVVQRTPAALECLRQIVASCSALIVGAGTVLDATQATACIDAGAAFIVSPGLDDDVVATAVSRQVDVIPGVMTPTEVQHAHGLGLTTVKFFPATLAGGVSGLRALSSVFRTMNFIPTGGISAANLGDYLELDCVLACGGSWLTPKDAIDAGDFERVTDLAREAIAIATRADAA